jgi:hypothetical protein
MEKSEISTPHEFWKN